MYCFASFTPFKTVDPIYDNGRKSHFHLSTATVKLTGGGMLPTTTF